MTFPPPTPRQARILWMSLTALAIGILLALIGLLLAGFAWVINRLSAVLLPLAVAGILAYLLDPLVDLFEKKMRRVWAILSVFFLALFLVFGMLATAIPRLIAETEAFKEKWPTYRQAIREKFVHFIENPPLDIVPEEWKEKILGRSTVPAGTNELESPVVITNVSPDGGEIAGTTNQVDQVQPRGTLIWETEWGSKALAWLAGVVPTIGAWFLAQIQKVTSWAGLLVGLALVPVYTFYFLLEEKSIEKSWTDYLPIRESRTKEEVVFVLSSINHYLILFFRGQVLVALADGLLLTIGFLIIGLDFAVLFGFVAGLLSIVPYLGVMISLIPTTILALVQSGVWWYPLLVLGIFALVQLAEGLFIAPKIMGDKVGLHPLTIIIAVLIGTSLLGGIIGGILAIPLTAALRVLMFRYVWKRPAEPVERPHLVKGND